MDFSLSEEQQAVRELASRIFTEKAAPERLRELEVADDPQGPFDGALWNDLTEAGLLSIALGEDVGGAGLDFVALAQVIDAAGQTAAYAPVVETLVAAADTIERFGTESQRQEWLPKIGEGQLIATAATAELVDGHVVDGIASISTTATPSADGYVLSGVKACVASGLRADLLLIPARLPDGAAGIFLVDSSAVSVERQEAASRPEAIVILDEVSVSADRLLGEGSDGDAQLASLATRTTAALCLLEAGAVTAAVRLGAEYTSEREQFEKKIATFQAVGQRMADAYVDAEAIRLTALQAAWRIAQGLDATDETAIAKFWAADGGQRVVHAATHVHGGVGVDRDYPLHRYFLLTRQIELSLGGATQSVLGLGRRIAERA